MMTTNGKRRPPRPSLQVVAPGAGPQEAAAIAAALEQFLRDLAPPPRKHAGLNPWTRAALAERVGIEAPDSWGTGLDWGA
jgi:hypothetical protein